MRRYRPALVIGCFILSLLVSGRNVVSQRKAPMNADEESREDEVVVTVQSRDLGRRVRVIGALGVELGTVVTIRGMWIEAPQARQVHPSFRIDEVNGRRLGQSVVFHPALIEAFGGQSDAIERRVDVKWELRGYERCTWHGAPFTAYEEVGLGAVSQPHETGFHSEFVYYKHKRL